MRVAAVGTEERVLIHAAAGGIGHLAVRIAKAHELSETNRVTGKIVLTP